MQFFRKLTDLVCVATTASAAAGLLAAAPAFAQASAPARHEVTDPAVVREAVPELKFNVYRPRDLMQRRTPAPVIAWGNGGCMKFDFLSLTLVERWAAAGYVVITYNDPEAMKGGMPDMALLSAMVDAQTAAQIRMLDWAEQANGKRGRYAGKLDTSRMVLAGNSCGGITAIKASWQDKRAKSLFILSGSANVPGTPDEKRKADAARIALPAMYIVGGNEDLARAPVRIEWAAMRPHLAAVLVERSSGDHPTVSNDPVIQLDEAAIGLNWFRATLYGDRAAARELAAKGCAKCDPKVWAVRSRNLPGVK
jgi:predicted alpha/beta-hydrolase family hydrolase